MNYIVLLVLHDLTKVDQILTAWEETGVSGVTIIPSTGLGRIRESFSLRDDIPLIPSLNDLLNLREELSNRTIFSIVESEQLVDKIIAATENVLGDMDQPRKGIIAVLPLARIHGLNRNWKSNSES